MIDYDESDLEKIKFLKNKFVKNQDYETAVWLRNVEKVLIYKVDESENRKLGSLNNNDIFTRDQVKELIDLSRKKLEEEILAIKIREDKNVTKIKELEETILGIDNLSVDYGHYLITKYNLGHSNQIPIMIF